MLLSAQLDKSDLALGQVDRYFGCQLGHTLSAHVAIDKMRQQFGPSF